MNKKIILSFVFILDFIKNMIPFIYYNKPSTIDWCEKNYIITPYIAEFYNSISMTPGIILITYGLLKSINIRYNFHVIISYLLAIWLSIGSFMFHATLNKFWQAQDELPMLYLGIWTFVCALKLYKIECKYVYDSFIVICILITELYSRSNNYIEFIVPYIIITITSLLSILYHILYLGNSENKKIGLIGISSILVGFVFWLIDNLFCDIVIMLNFHAIWHLCIGVTKYSLIRYLDLEN